MSTSPPRHQTIEQALRSAGHPDLAQSLASLSERDEVLWRGKYLSVCLRDGWYEFLRNGTGHLVAVLGYWGNHFLGRYEVCPPHNANYQMCALTGGVEQGEDPLAAAIREVKEEAGLDTEATQYRSLGTVRPSKASDTVAHLFACDLRGAPDYSRYRG
jgi:hypothetical protein